MKPVKMFIMEACPYCKKARAWMDEVFEAHPEYRAVHLTIIDERREPDLANSYDYWYVPTYYVGDEKRHEGVATKEIVERVFAEAYAG